MLKLILLFATAIVIIAGCSRKANDVREDARSSEPGVQTAPQQANGQREGSIELTRVGERELPAPVRSWVASMLQFDATPYVGEYIHEGKRYLLAARGRKNTGGYDVRFAGAWVEDASIKILIRFTRPPADAMVTQVITYPFDIAVIGDTVRTIGFVAEGNDAPAQFYPLVGVDRVKRITAQSERIKIFSPAPGDTVSRNVKITGAALVFEGTVNYRFRDGAGNEIGSGHTTAATGMGWGYYGIDFRIPDRIPTGADISVELYYIDAERGDERDHVGLQLKIES